MAVRIDLVEGELVQGDTGYEATRVALVDNVPGEAAAKLYNAINTAGVPAMSEAHPVIPNAYVAHRSASFAEGSSSTVEVTCIYRWISPSLYRQQSEEPNDQAPGLIRVGASLQTVQQNTDKSGNEITVSYTFPDDFGDEDLDGKAFPATSVMVDVDVPVSVMTRTRRELSPPTQKARDYVGKVNQARIWNGEPRTWLCTGIEGVSNDDGATFDVSYEFTYRPETWDVTVVFLNPKTREPVSLADNDAQRPNALKTVQVYPEALFSLLGLDFE